MSLRGAKRRGNLVVIQSEPCLRESGERESTLQKTGFPLKTCGNDKLRRLKTILWFHGFLINVVKRFNLYMNL